MSLYYSFDRSLPDHRPIPTSSRCHIDSEESVYPGVSSWCSVETRNWVKMKLSDTRNTIWKALAYTRVTKTPEPSWYFWPNRPSLSLQLQVVMRRESICFWLNDIRNDTSWNDFMVSHWGESVNRSFCPFVNPQTWHTLFCHSGLHCLCVCVSVCDDLYLVPMATSFAYDINKDKGERWFTSELMYRIFNDYAS